LKTDAVDKMPLHIFSEISPEEKVISLITYLEQIKFWTLNTVYNFHAHMISMQFSF